MLLFLMNIVFEVGFSKFDMMLSNVVFFDLFILCSRVIILGCMEMVMLFRMRL